MDRTDITAELAARLVASQFPEWADLAIYPVDVPGWDNITFRLGDDKTVRLPSAPAYEPQVEKEHRWLPYLAQRLPLPIPQPIGKGAPALGFPRRWSIYRWMPGIVANAQSVSDLERFAQEIGAFLRELHRIDAEDGPLFGSHSFQRGGPVAFLDAQTREAIDALRHELDRDAALAAWESALKAEWEGPATWVHGDVAGTNLLVDRHGRLSAVLDFGCSAVGDPACDLTIAWTLLRGRSREIFRSTVGLDDATWARGRGWALWKALVGLRDDVARASARPANNPETQWTGGPREVISEVLQDHRAER